MWMSLTERKGNMRIIERNPITVYKFEELSDKAKQKAIDNHRYQYVSDTWWLEHIEEQLDYFGVKIERLDVHWHHLDLVISDYDKLVDGIKSAFGKETELYEAAVAYEIYKDTDMYAANDFRNYVQWEYMQIIQSEYNYLTRDEYIAEKLQDSYHEFYEDGETY